MSKPIPITDNGQVLDMSATEILSVERIAEGVCCVVFAARRTIFSAGDPYTERAVVLRLTVPEAALPSMARALMARPVVLMGDPAEDFGQPSLNS